MYSSQFQKLRQRKWQDMAGILCRSRMYEINGSNVLLELIVFVMSI